MKAVIMAGGEGTRLRPLTSHRPKPLVPVLNVPIMEHIVLLLKRHGVTDIVVTLHYLADEIEGYFGDGADWGVNLVYSVEDTPLGTAGSVKKAEAHLQDDTFLIVSGDALTDIDFGKAISYHRSQSSIATLVLSHVHNPLEFGVVIADETGAVRRFVEKPSWSEVFSDTVNTGMYILDPSIFQYMEPDRAYDWSQDIFPRLLADERPLFGYVMDGDYWCDIGNLEQYRESQYTALDGHTRLLEANATASDAGGVHVGDGSEIDPSAQLIGPVLIGRNCRIKAGAVVGPHAVLGDQTIIEEQAVVIRSVLWDNVYVGVASNLNSCTVCSHTTIKEYCVVQEGAVIGDRCRIENASTIRTQIKLWPDKIIEAGSTVTMSLVWGQKWAGSLFRKQGVMGIANIEMTPDFACKLGASFGGYLRRGGLVVTSRDSGRAPRMLKRALISGLLSVGVNVLDMRSMPLPIARHAIRASQAGGGAHIRLAPDNPRAALIEFYDEDGIYLSKAVERKVETIFFREDFRRVDAEQVGLLEFAGRGVEQYADDFYHHLNADILRDRRFKVVADFAFGRLAGIYPTILGRMGCEVVALNAYADVQQTPKSPDARSALLSTLTSMVHTVQADMGVIFEADGERMTLVDETGAVIGGLTLLGILAGLAAQTHPGALVATPVGCPNMIDTVVQRAGGTVLRTRTPARDLMEACRGGTERAQLAGDEAGGFIFSEFQPTFDAMYAFAKLLEMLVATGQSVSQAGADVPPAFVGGQDVRCPWELKGRVMRALADEAETWAGADGRLEYIDGIKLYRGADWVLVLPDMSDPVFHIRAEAADQERADSLVREFAQKLEALRG